MNWHDLSVLLALSRGPSMTAAAQRLGVAQTTVARRLGALEEKLGVQLVERRPDGVRLTEEGTRAVEAAEQMETLALDLERGLAGTSARLSGRLRVATVDVLAGCHANLFMEFAEAYPDIDLEVVTGYGLHSLARREADLALRFGVPDESLFGRKLVRVGYAAFAHRSLVGDGSRSLADLPWLAWTPMSRATPTDRWLAAAVPGARVVCSYDAGLVLLAAMRAGGGAGIMACAHAHAHPELVQLTEPIEELAYDLWALTHPDLSRTARVRAFLRHAAAYFDQRRAVYAGG